MSYTFLQNYWWFLISLLGGLLVFLMFVQGANLHLGNRTLMMDQGRVIYDVSGEERNHLTVHDLTEKFREKSGRELNNDRMLLGR